MKYQFVRLNGSPWPAQHADMLKKLGVRRLPEAGMSPRMVEGIKVWVTPLEGERPGEGKRNGARIMCECPGCGHHVSAGRLAQHKCDATRRVSRGEV